METGPGIVVEYLSRERSRMPREVLELAVLGAYQRGVLTAGKSSELLQISVADFLHLASKAGVSVLDAEEEEISRELRASRGPSRA